MVDKVKNSPRQTAADHEANRDFINLLGLPFPPEAMKNPGRAASGLYMRYAESVPPEDAGILCYQLLYRIFNNVAIFNDQRNELISALTLALKKFHACADGAAAHPVQQDMFGKDPYRDLRDFTERAYANRPGNLGTRAEALAAQAKKLVENRGKPETIPTELCVSYRVTAAYVMPPFPAVEPPAPSLPNIQPSSASGVNNEDRYGEMALAVIAVFPAPPPPGNLKIPYMAAQLRGFRNGGGKLSKPVSGRLTRWKRTAGLFAAAAKECLKERKTEILCGMRMLVGQKKIGGVTLWNITRNRYARIIVSPEMLHAQDRVAEFGPYAANALSRLGRKTHACIKRSRVYRRAIKPRLDHAKQGISRYFNGNPYPHWPGPVRSADTSHNALRPLKGTDPA